MRQKRCETERGRRLVPRASAMSHDGESPGRSPSLDSCLRISPPAMSYQMLSLTVNERIATITVNRPEKLNALNDATIAELGSAIDELRANVEVAAIILTGAGRAFVAGADIAELSDRSPASLKSLAQRGQEVFR